MCANNINWPLIAIYHGRIFYILRIARLRLLEALHVPHHYSPHSHHNPLENGFNEERVYMFLPGPDDWNEAGHNPEDYNEEDGARPQDMQEQGYPTAPHALRNRGRRPNVEMMQEGGDETSGPRDRLLPHTGPRLRAVGQPGSFDPNGVTPRIPSRTEYTQPDQTPPGIRGGAARLTNQMPERTPFEYYHLQAPIIWLGVIIGLISYTAQWLFWDGFVTASGDR